MGFILQEIKNKTKQQQKLPRRRKTGQLARFGWAGHNKTKQEQDKFDDELAQDCKHKEIIKVANEEGNEGIQVGKMKQ